MSSQPSSAEAAKFHDLLAKFKTAMLVTHTPEGSLRGRPMAIAGLDPDNRVWFFTAQESGKTDEIVQDTHVGVLCQKEHEIYISLSGKASVSRDRQKIDELWRDTFKTWFPDGKDDPHLALVSVTPEQGEFWDSAGMNKIKYLFEAAKAFATHTTPHIDEGDQHAKVKL